MHSASPSSAERVPILLYHRIAEPQNAWEARLCVSPGVFKAQMRHLAARGMHACHLDQFMQWLVDGVPLPKGSFLLTFDDGFLDVYQNAFPLLNDLGWSATTFLISTLIGQSDVWCQSDNPSGAKLALMDETKIREMQSYGFSFQSHTRTHPFLTKLDDDALEHELVGAQRELEDLLGHAVPTIAYPYGRMDERVAAKTKEVGYRAAFSCKPGLNKADVDRFNLRRVEVLGHDSPVHLTRKMRFGTNVGSLKQALKYYPSKVVEKVTVKLFG